MLLAPGGELDAEIGRVQCCALIDRRHLLLVKILDIDLFVGVNGVVCKCLYNHSQALSAVPRRSSSLLPIIDRRSQLQCLTVARLIAYRYLIVVLLGDAALRLGSVLSGRRHLQFDRRFVGGRLLITQPVKAVELGCWCKSIGNAMLVQ